MGISGIGKIEREREGFGNYFTLIWFGGIDLPGSL